jgi:hypothetical protein
VEVKVSRLAGMNGKHQPAFGAAVGHSVNDSYKIQSSASQSHWTGVNQQITRSNLACAIVNRDGVWAGKTIHLLSQAEGRRIVALEREVIRVLVGPT